MNRLLLGLCLVGVVFNVFAQQSKDSKSNIGGSSAESINQGNEETRGLHGARSVPGQNGWMKSYDDNTHSDGKEVEHPVNSDVHAQSGHGGDESVHDGGKKDEHPVNSDVHAQGGHGGDESVHNGGKKDEHPVNSDVHAQGGHGGGMDEGGKGAVHDGKSPDGHDHNEHGSKDWRRIKNSDWENSAKVGNKGGNEQGREMEYNGGGKGEHGEQTEANSMYKGIIGNEGGSGSKTK